MTTKVKLTVNGGWWQFRDALKAGHDFDTPNGTLYGRNTPEGGWRWGRLDYDLRDSVKRADYVIWSYSTPIAWRTDGEWHAPEVKYSVTTSRHQGRIFTAISQLRES
jgi:hypothetical protein